jgi:cation transport regulator ChaB
MPARQELPSTLRRSSKRAQEIWSKAHDSAVKTYGEGQRAHRTAYAALKHEFEKVGDHWEPKASAGPSDEQARRGTPSSRRPRATAGGVDANASKEHLYRRAQQLRIPGRSRMTKQQLVEALQRESARRTAARRRRG